MEHGSSYEVEEQSHSMITIKTEVEETPQSCIEIELNMDVVEQEPGVVLVVKSEPGSPAEEEGNGSEDSPLLACMSTLLDSQPSDKATQPEQPTQPRLYRCEKCQNVLKTYANLCSHRRQVHGTDTQKCVECDKEFKCKTYLLNHVRYAHCDQQYECTTCNKMYKSRPALHNHVLSRHRYRCADIQNSSYNCGKCLKTYQSKETLRKHYKHLHGKESHKCTRCDKNYKCKAYLRTHMNYAHGDEKFECVICKQIFKCKRSLNNHVLRFHEHVPAGPYSKMYACDWCQKTFWKKPALRQHIDGVHGERIHRCVMCNRIYKSKNHLQLHKTSVHGKAQHECDVCRKLYTTRCRLMEHKKKHNSKDVQLKSDIKPSEVPNSCATESNLNAALNTNTEKSKLSVVTELPTVKTVIKWKSAFNSSPVKFQHAAYKEEPKLSIKNCQTKCSGTYIRNVTSPAVGTSTQQHKVVVVKERLTYEDKAECVMLQHLEKPQRD